ncbi:acyl-CoA carboxylase epsilon subunit [Streptomyces griseoincarnatus]
MGDPDRGALAGQEESALRLVSGQPGDEDIAALLAVLLALRAGGRCGGGRAGRAPPDVSGRWRGPRRRPGAPRPALTSDRNRPYGFFLAPYTCRDGRFDGVLACDSKRRPPAAEWPSVGCDAGTARELKGHGLGGRSLQGPIKTAYAVCY